MNTKFEYMYRDAANYKQFNKVIISGILSVEELHPFLRDKLLFIPSKVGLKDLQPEEWSVDVLKCVQSDKKGASSDFTRPNHNHFPS